MHPRRGSSSSAYVALLLVVAGLVACGRPVPAPPTFGDHEIFSPDPAVAELVSERLAAARAAPDQAQAWRGLGLAFEANGFPRQAVMAYDHAAALDPEDARTHYHVAVCLEELGDLEGAVERFSLAAELGARHPPIHWRQGFAELSLGRLDEAETSFLRALELHGLSQPARVGLARVALARGDAGTAIDHLEPLLAQGGAPAIARQLMNTASRLAGRTDDLPSELAGSRHGAVTESPGFDSSGTHWPDAWQQAVEASARGFPQRMREGERALAEGRFDDAAAIFRRLSEERPDDPLPKANLAATWIAGGRPAEAIALLEPLDPEGSSQRFNVVMNLAAAHFLTGNPEVAKTYAERARALDPGKPRPPEMLGAILLSEGRGEEALELLELAVRLDPNNSLTRLRLARAYQQLGRSEDAAEHLRRLEDSRGAGESPR